MAKKKKPKKKLGFALSQEEQEEEMIALQAIFGEDFHPEETNSHAFVLHVVPHPGELESNFVSIDLNVR